MTSRHANSRKIEWAIFTIMCLLALWLNIVLYCHCGAFWRDETSTIQVATAPRLDTMWAWLSRDPFPALFAGLLRLWIFSGVGATDAGIRLFGTLISLGVLASVFASCRTLTGRVPLLATSLVAFNVAVFYYGSSLRAYGLATLLIMLCCAAFWRMSRGPTRWNIAASLALAVASCHANYQNTYLLLGIGLAGTAACAVCRLWRRAALILGICSAAALSMLIYIPAILEYREANQVTSYSLRWQRLAVTFSESLAGQSKALLVAWVAMMLAAFLCVCADVYRQCRSGAIRKAPSLSLFCLLATVVAGGCGFVFFKVHGMLPTPWHYVPLIAFTGIMIDVGLASAPKAWKSWAVMLVSSTIVALSLPGMWTAAYTRRTNLDVVSQVLANEAGPKDLVLVDPFWFSPGFNYYYRGSAPWDTLPLISEGPNLKICPYFSIKRLMTVPNAIAPALERVERTLKAGNRLWIVGAPQFLPRNAKPLALPPAPHPQYGWDNYVYKEAWSMQLCYYLQTHVRAISFVSIEMEQPVNDLENVSLIRVEGWQACLE